MYSLFNVVAVQFWGFSFVLFSIILFYGNIAFAICIRITTTGHLLLYLFFHHSYHLPLRRRRRLCQHHQHPHHHSVSCRYHI